MKKMNVLIGCEYSGIVRDAFAAKGHYAVSCDLLPTESKGLHYIGDIFDIINSQKWDLGIFFPPCTYLCRAQVHLLKDKERHKKYLQAIEFVKKIWESKNIDRICIENPIGLLSTDFMKPTQIVSFNMFGDPYKKDICLWLKNLPHLKPTKIVPATKRVQNHVNSRMTKEEKNKIKSKFFPGIAKAMANEWTDIPVFSLNDLSVDLSPVQSQDLFSRIVPSSVPGSLSIN